MEINTNTVIFIFYVLYGVVIGSFLNVCIYRIPLKISISKGRSYCPKCNNVIAPYDLIPIFSYVFLCGKCRNCKDKISPRYACVEAITGLLFGLVFLSCGFTVKSIIYCLMSAVLVVIFFIDIDTQEIPDSANLFLLLLGIASAVLVPEVPLSSRVVGMFIISVPMLIIAYFTNGFGGGDIKMIGACGLILGFKSIILAFLLAVIMGGLFAVYLLIIRSADRKSLFAFGPFIAVGVFISAICGNIIINWYLSLLILS